MGEESWEGAEEEQVGTGLGSGQRQAGGLGSEGEPAMASGI